MLSAETQGMTVGASKDIIRKRKGSLLLLSIAYKQSDFFCGEERFTWRVRAIMRTNYAVPVLISWDLTVSLRYSVVATISDLYNLYKIFFLLFYLHCFSHADYRYWNSLEGSSGQSFTSSSAEDLPQHHLASCYFLHRDQWLSDSILTNPRYAAELLFPLHECYFKSLLVSQKFPITPNTSGWNVRQRVKWCKKTSKMFRLI